jgi:malonyl-CoA/methylmalonyl-CoA synthetase
MANPLFDQLFGKHAGKTTPFLHLTSGATLTHAEFLGQAAQIAHALTEFGLKPGDRLAAQIEKSPEALALYAACAQAGVIFLPLNTAYTVDELTYFIENSGATLLVCGARSEAALTPIATGLGAKLATLNADGSGSLTETAKSKPATFDVVDRSADDLAAFLYTSGTTGRSKGAMLTQANLLSNAETLTNYWKFTDADVLLHALPIFHTHGLFVATNVMLAAGGSMIFLPKFDLDAMIANLPKATSMMGVPTFYTRLLDDARFTKDLTSHMRLFVSGCAASGRNPCAFRRAHRPSHPRTLRHDRNQHEHVEPL